MTTEKPAFPPRGTFQDDSPSKETGAARPFVNGSSDGAPYRDAVAALHARRRALIAEIEEIDRVLAPPPPLGAPTPADRALSEPDWLDAIVRAPWLRPVLGGLVGVVGVVGAIELAASHASEPPAFVHHDVSVVEVDAANFVVARTLVDRLATGRFSRTALAPVVEKGVVVGLRIESNGPDEASALGLRDGDVVLAVDEHAIAAPDGARLAFETLRLATELELVVRRGDEVRRLRYHVVG